MAEPSRFDETIGRLVQANVRWYEAMGRVYGEYVQELSRVLADVALRRLPAPSAAPRSEASAPPRPATTLVLEAEAGQLAQGVFMVENRLARPVTAAVTSAGFSGGAEGDARPALRIQPATVTLEPGGRTLVQVSALIDDRLEPGTRYQGQVSVPGLSDSAIPVLVRRTPSSSPPRSAPTQTSAAAAAPRPRRSPRRKPRR